MRGFNDTMSKKFWIRHSLLFENLEDLSYSELQ